MAIDTCVENFSGTILKALAASTPKCRPWPTIPAGIQDEIRLKNRLRRQWQVTRDTTLKAEVNRLQRSVTRRHNEWRDQQWSLRSSFLTLASEPKLTNIEELQEAIRGLKVSKAMGPTGVPNRDLKHFPQRAGSLLSRFSTQFSSPIISLQCGSTLVLYTQTGEGSSTTLILSAH
jgi:hypothetical protein